MTKYIALLRGVNVGGNNRVPMRELKEQFEAIGFEDVLTYINSGNIIFHSLEQDETRLVKICEEIIETSFGVKTRVAIVKASELHEALDHAPSWWGADLESKHNAIFAIAPASSEEIIKEVGIVNSEYEKVASYGHVIFWSAPIKTFGKTRLSRIVGTKAYSM